MTPEEEIELLQLYEMQDPKYQFPESPQTVPKQEPGITGMQALEAAAHGAGQGATFGFSDELAGAYGAATGDGYTESRDKYRKTLAENRERAPVISAMGDVAGSLPSGMGLFKAAQAPSTFLGSAAFGGLEAGLNAVGRGDNADDIAGSLVVGVPAAAGAAGLGYGATEIYNRIRRGMKQTPGLRQKQAEKLGIELTPGEQFGDQSLMRAEAAMKSDPGYGRPFDAMNARNQEKVNQIAGKTIGLDNVKQLTEAEMGKAAQDINSKFKAATSAGDKIVFDESWLNSLGDIEAQYRKVWGKSGASPKIIDDILETTQRGAITPTEYQRRYSQLGKDLESARVSGDKHKMELYGELRTALDDLVDRNFDGLSDQFKEARKLYKNKILLQKPGVTRTETGNVSPKVLANKLQQTDKKGYMEGENTSDLYNMARVAKGVDSGIGDSGTATRSKDLMDFVTGPVKERVSQAYLSGKVGANMFGGSTGKGGAINPFLNSLMQSPELLRAALDEVERSGVTE